MSRSYDPTALDEFISLLDKYRLDCGEPSLRELVPMSQRVVKDARYRNLPTLSLTALSDVLNRRRVRPPKFRWVAAFVLACQRFAEESGLRPDQSPSTLEEWNRRLQAVYGIEPKPAPAPAAPASSADEDGGSLPGSGRPGASAPTEPLAAPVPDCGLPDHDRAGEGAVEPAVPRPFGGPSEEDGVAARIQRLVAGESLDDGIADLGVGSLSELRFGNLYGPYGARLFGDAEEHRDPDACYRLGVLLCLDDRPVESLFWLRLAETEGHLETRELIETTTPRQPAVAHARRLGLEAARAGDGEIAELFLNRAADHGDANAAFALGVLCMEHQDSARAAQWFTRAAERGHGLGRWWADRLNHEDAGKLGEAGDAGEAGDSGGNGNAGNAGRRARPPSPLSPPSPPPEPPNTAMPTLADVIAQFLGGPES